VITNNNQTEVNFDFYDDVFFPTIIELCMCLENVQNVKKTKLDSRSQGGT
jgi:hypothetical protein